MNAFRARYPKVVGSNPTHATIEYKRHSLYSLCLLEQLNRQAEAEDVLEKLYRKFWYRFHKLSNTEWRDLLLLLNVEVHVKPILSVDEHHTIPGDFSRIENIWRDIEKNKFRWTPTEPTDTIIEVRFGVPLGCIEPLKVRDCVLPTWVGRAGLEPATP